MKNKSILIFGAGKIGLSFIGQLFGQSGYNVAFTDDGLDLVNELNRRKSENLIIQYETKRTIAGCHQSQGTRPDTH